MPSLGIVKLREGSLTALLDTFLSLCRVSSGYTDLQLASLSRSLGPATLPSGQVSKYFC